MTMQRNITGRIAVTGIGIITSLGIGKADNWGGLIEGKSGVRRITRFPIDELRTTIAATVDDFDVGDNMSCARRVRLMINEVVAEAIAEASSGSPIAPLLPQASVFAAVPGGEEAWFDRIGLHKDADRKQEILDRIQQDGLTEYTLADLQSRYGLLRRPTIVTTACASGATAVQLAVDAIRRGETRVALAAAADSTVSPEGLIRFSLLSALSRCNDRPETASKPFDLNRDGFVMGEGAAALVLESESHAVDRGATILGYIRGCGDATDNFHRTRSNPTGERISACITRALDDAGITRSDVHAVNAHGTSTPENDKMEALGLRLALGSALDNTVVTSNKSMVGHTLSAAGLVEIVFSLLSVRDGIVPPSINITTLDDSLGLNVATKAVRPPDLQFVVSNSFGFGGQNVSVVVERA